MDEETRREVPPGSRSRHAASGPPDDGPDDWRQAENTAGAHPGSAIAWAGLMAMLVAGLTLLGAAFTDGDGLLFAAGLALAGAAFVIPLELAGRRER